VLDQGSQFAAGLTKELNRMLGIKMKLSMAFHLQTDRQMEHMNQELEQYLKFFMENRQKDWLKWLASAEFTVNNTATKVSPFMANYGRELRMGGYKKKGEGKEHEEAVVALRKIQEEIKRYADRSRRETEEWKKGDRVMLSMKDLVFKERLVWKLMKRYVGPYVIEEVVSLNAVKLQLPSSMRIHLIVNVSQIVQYKE